MSNNHLTSHKMILQCVRNSQSISSIIYEWPTCMKTICHGQVYFYIFMGVSTRESSPSRATGAQGRWPSVGPSALPSSGRFAIFFYCRSKPKSQQKLWKTPPPTLSQPLQPPPAPYFPNFPPSPSSDCTCDLAFICRYCNCDIVFICRYCTCE